VPDILHGFPLFSGKNRRGRAKQFNSRSSSLR
jgi:hypothetical protein